MMPIDKNKKDNIARGILTYKDFKRILDITNASPQNTQGVDEGMFKNMAIDLQDLSADEFYSKYKITKAEAMRKFGKSESVIDIPQKTYAKEIFDNADTEEPKLKESVRKIILDQIEEFKKKAPVIKFSLIGSILTKQYRDDADLDVNVLFDVPESQRDEKRLEIAKSLKDINGKTVPGTNHPINYFVLTDPKLKERNDNLSDGIFDVVKNEFIKKPIPFEFKPEKYAKEFEDKVKRLDVVKGELERDIIDYEDLKRLDSDNIDNLKGIISTKIGEIMSGIKALVDSGDQTLKDRKEVFDADLTPDEIREYGKKNALPKNVIYKMLEKYHYLTFYKKLKAIIKDGEVSDAEISSIKESSDPNDMSSKFDFGLDDYEMDAIIRKYDHEDPLDDDDYLDIYDDDELDVVDDEDINYNANDIPKIKESLTRPERIKSRIRFARTKAKRNAKLRLALKRASTMDVVNKRARRLAINKIKKLLFKKSPANMSVAEKERAEKRLAALPKSYIDNFAMKLVPTIRKIERTRLSR
jgi:predicted nucleotidyltransferase